MKNVIKFKVLPPNFDSKHALITATFKSSFVIFGKGKVLNRPKRYKRDNQGAVLFHSILNQKDTQEKLGKLRFDLDSSSNANAIQKAAKQFTKIISESGHKTLGIKKRGKVNKKPKKPWYRENCTLLRKQSTRIAKILQKDPKTSCIMGQCRKIKKSYKHKIKISKQNWQISNIQKLSELTKNPKLFWSHLKLLRGATKSSTPNGISPQRWVEHFSKLLYSENERIDNFFYIMMLMEI